MAIHPTAVIDRKAELDSTVEVGPYVIIEGPVKIGARTRIRAHACLSGWTEIGEDCQFYPYAIIGGDPQDYHYKGERSYCRIGSRVNIREGSSVHRGSQPESATTIGDDTMLLSWCHVGHNCQIGKHVLIQNGAQCSGHIIVHDRAIIGGYTLSHQFIRVGTLAFLVPGARVGMDVPPFMMCQGETTVVGHNVIGMRRAGYSAEEIFEIRQAYRTLYRSGLLFRDAVKRVVDGIKTDAGRLLASFLQSESKRGFAVGGSHRNRTGSTPDREDDAIAGADNT